MPFDSQGNFTRVMNWQEDAANSIPILASRHDDEDDNFANGFNEVMCRDGRTQMTGQLKMGSNKIVGVATGTASTDAVNKGQLDSALAGAVAGKQNTITGGASSITSSNLTINRALISNGSGKVAVSNTTNTELGYVHGVTSAIQTQLDARPTATESKARNGYIKFGNGIIIQWGQIAAGDNEVTVSLPTSFSGTNYQVSVQHIKADNTELWPANVGNKATSSFKVYTRGGAVNIVKSWIAIGY